MAVKRIQNGVTNLIKTIEQKTSSIPTFQMKSDNHDHQSLNRTTNANQPSIPVSTGNTSSNTTSYRRSNCNSHDNQPKKTKKTRTNIFTNMTSSYLLPMAKKNGICCVICQKLLILDGGMYQYHPFFPNERICMNHSNPNKCLSCQRFLPTSTTTTLCHNCINYGGGIIQSSSSIDLVQSIWKDVCDFFHQNHLFSSQLFPNISTKTLQKIPILIVHSSGLQDTSIRGTQHHGSTTSTRGLCMYTYTPGGAFQQWLQQQQQQQENHSNNWKSHPFFQSVSKTILKVPTFSRIQAILCLEQLPRLLTTSILVHEATHAWFKSQHILTNLPIQIEEGCCQLMAYLWLQQQLEYDHNCSKERNQLLQYYMYSIETDPSEIYGNGYRQVAASYSKMMSSSSIHSQDIISHFLHYIIHNLKLPNE